MKGLVLAGGDSRRFGSNKALAQWSTTSGETFAERTYKVLCTVCEEVWISSRIKDRFDFTNNIILDESTRSEGPGAGFRSFHRKFPGDSVFVMACDYPLADAACAQFLTSRWSNNQKALVFSGSQSKYEPLIGIWSAETLATFLSDPLPGPHWVLDTLDLSGLPCPNPNWLKNINYASDLKAPL